MNNMNTLICILFVVSCVIVGIIWSFPAQSQVEVEPTAFLHDATSINVDGTTIVLQQIRFRDGTVCIVSDSKYTSHAHDFQCDFSNSALVHKQ